MPNIQSKAELINAQLNSSKQPEYFIKSYQIPYALHATGCPSPLTVIDFNLSKKCIIQVNLFKEISYKYTQREIRKGEGAANALHVLS